MDEDRQKGRGSLKNRTADQSEQMSDSPGDLTNDSFKRKRGDQMPGNRTTRNQKPGRMTERFDQVSVSSGTKSGFGGNEEDNERLMVLSQEARDALVSMQRFDRFIYVAESQKHLKAPIEGQLKRLQKIKNSGNKLMKNTYFDNELTITCLFNHMKNMYELNRDLGQIVKLKAEIETLQQKIIEQNVKYNKDVKEAANQAKGKAAEDQQTLRDTLKVIDSIISALKDNNSARGQKKLEGELKRSSESRKQLIQLIHNLLSRVGGGAVEDTIEVNEGGADIYQTNLEKLIKEQGSAAKNILYLQSQKSVFEKSAKQAPTDDVRGIFKQLVQTSSYMIVLNTTIKDTQMNLLEAQKKTVSIPAQSESEKQTLQQLKKLQALVNAFEADGESWHRQMELINLKVENDGNYSADLTRIKKLINGKKAINSTVSKLVNPYLSLLGMLSEKTQSASESRNLEQKNAQLQQTNTALENELLTLKTQLDLKNPKGQLEVNKLITMVQQILFKDSEKPASANQLLKAKKFIQVNRKKFPEDFRPTLACLEALISMAVDSQQRLTHKETEDSKTEQQRNKEVNSLDLMYKTLEKVLATNDPVNDGFLNKVRRSLQQNNSKVEKMETPFNNLIRTANGNLFRLFELLTETHGNSKSRGDSQSESKVEVDNLARQLKQKESEIQNYIKNQDRLQKKIQDHDRDLSTVNTQVITTRAQVDRLLVALQGARDREVELEKENRLREEEVQELQNRYSKSLQRIEGYEVTISQIRDSSKTSSNEGYAKDQEIDGLREAIELRDREAKSSIMEANDLTRQLQHVNKQLSTLRQECHRHQQQKKGAEQEVENLTQINQESTHVVKDLNAEIDELHSRVQTLTQLNQQYQEQISLVQLGSSDEKNHISTLTLEVDALNSQISTLQSAIQKSNTQKLKAHSEFCNQTADLDRIRGQHESLKGQLSQLRSSYQAERTSWARDQAAKGQVQVNVRNKQIELDQERSRHQSEMSTLRDNYYKLQNSLLQQKRLFEDLQRSQTNNQTLVNQTAQIQAFEMKTRELEYSLGQLTQENNDLHLGLNNYSSQVSSLQNQTRMLEAQLKDQNNQLQKIKIQNTTAVTTGVSQYESQRYVALKEENVVLKEEIVLRDQTILEMEQGHAKSSANQSGQTSSQKTQEAIRILQAQLQQLRQKAKVSDFQRMTSQNKELSEAIKIRQINLQNALGDNEYLFRQINKYKENEGSLQNQVQSLTAQLTSVRANSSSDSGKDTAVLKQQVTGLTSLKTRLESDIRILQKASRETGNENLSLKQRIKSLEDGESAQKRLGEQLRQGMTSGKHVELKKSQDLNSLLTIKLQDMEKALRSMSEVRQSEQTVRLREENIELRQKLRHQQIQRTRGGDDASETQSRRDRSTLSDMIKEKGQFISTIKSMQTLLHSKDVKLLQLYDQREQDLRHLIHQNKKLQEEINLINETLVKEKIKFLISPKSIEDSLMRMEQELVEVKRQNFVLKEEIQTLELELEKGKALGHDEVKSVSGYGLDKTLYERVRMLQVERIRLVGRISLLSVYNRIQNQSQALVSNVNRLIDNVVVFLSDSEDFGDCDLANNQFLPGVEQYLDKQDYEHYFQHVEDFFKDLFLRVVGRKNQILERQAEQLMLLREKMQELLNEQGDDGEQSLRSYHERSSRSYRVEQNTTKKRASQIALQHLFKLYLKAKDPAVLRQISELLSFSQGRFRVFD